jgi:hypothetical protein
MRLEGSQSDGGHELRQLRGQLVGHTRRDACRGHDKPHATSRLRGSAVTDDGVPRQLRELNLQLKP